MKRISYTSIIRIYFSAIAHVLAKIDMNEDRELLQNQYKDISDELQLKTDALRRYRHKVLAQHHQNMSLLLKLTLTCRLNYFKRKFWTSKASSKENGKITWRQSENRRGMLNCYHKYLRRLLELSRKSAITSNASKTNF